MPKVTIDKISFELLHCCTCGIAFALPGDFTDQLKGCHNYFSCPNGHSQHFTGESDVDKVRKLQKELDKAQQELAKCTRKRDSKGRFVKKCPES